MDNFQGQVEAILKAKGIRPSGMTEEEFERAVFMRLHDEFPSAMATAVEKAANGILNQEMIKVGRTVACRYAMDYKSKKCPKERDCMACPNYRPISWFRRNPFEVLYIGEAVFFTIAYLNFLVAIALPEIRTTSLIVWFILLVGSRFQLIWHYGMIRKAGLWTAPQWLKIIVKRSPRI